MSGASMSSGSNMFVSRFKRFETNYGGSWSSWSPIVALVGSKASHSSPTCVRIILDMRETNGLTKRAPVQLSNGFLHLPDRVARTS